MAGKAGPDGAAGRTGAQVEVPVCGRWSFPGKLGKVSRAGMADLRSRRAEPAGTADERIFGGRWDGCVLSYVS